MRTLKKWSVALCLVFAVTRDGRGLGQIPDGWEIVEITPAGGEYELAWDLNDRGQGVFRLWGDASVPSTCCSVVLFDGGRFIAIADESDVIDQMPVINNRCEIIWARDRSPYYRNAIMKWHRATIEVISDDQDLNQLDPDINDAGQIVWQLRDPPSGDWNIMSFDGSSTIPLGHERFSDQVPRLNEFGQFIWWQSDFRQKEDILLFDRGNVRRLNADGTRCSTAALNDRLQVVWVDRSMDEEVVVWDNGTERRFGHLAARTYINNDGQITFVQWDPGARVHTLWLYSDGELFKLTTPPDNAYPVGINARGEILFTFGHIPATGIALYTRRAFVADLDFDGDVDLNDVAVFQRCHGRSTDLFDECCSSSDTNRDEAVDAVDLATLVGYLEGPGKAPSDVYDYWRDNLRLRCERGE